MRTIAALAVALLCAGPVLAQSQLPAHTTWGNPGASQALPQAMTQTQVQAMCNVFTSTLKGCVPLSGGGTSNFLRADGTWASPSPSTNITVGASTITGGTTNQILYDNAGVLGEITKGNNCVYSTNGSGVPSCSTTLPSGITAPSLTVTGAFTATGLVTNADLANPSVTVNSVVCTLGSTCSITATAASVTVGTTAVASGTTTRVLYDNAGVLGEYTNTQLTALINNVTASVSGTVPAFPNNTTTFFRGDGTYAALPSSFSGLANPSGSVGCTAVNGAATTAIRSDGAPALNLAASCTYTGNTAFSPASGNGPVITTASNALVQALTTVSVISSPTSTAGSTLTYAVGGQNVFLYNSILATDALNVTAGSPPYTVGANVGLLTGGTNSQGTKIAFSATINHFAASTPTSPAKRDHIAAGFFARSTVSDGGTNTGAGAQGTNFSGNFVSSLESGALNYLAANAVEVDCAIQSGASANRRHCLSVIANGIAGSSQAVGSDAGIEVSSTTTDNFKVGFVFSDQHSGGTHAPITVCVICTSFTGSYSITTGIDLSGFGTITGNLLAGPNGLAIDGQANVTAKTYNSTTAATGYKINGVSIINVNSAIYTQINDPVGTPKFFFGRGGGGGDDTGYFRNATLLYQNAAGTINYASFSVSGLSISDGTHTSSIFPSSMLIRGTEAIAAGGAANVGYCYSSVAGFCVFFGSSTPTLTAAKGSLYLRSDGSSSSTRAYINTDGATTWTAITTAS